MAVGKRLGHYEILESIGSGGMGEVYKARDPRLNRMVAIKVLLEHISDKSDARARFEREARTIAGLNHPHICVVYDIGQQDGMDFLVMELLEGETLARRLERGPLPVVDTLKYAIEIADALDKAHRHGVTHRDLKPGNIMLTPAGVKLLDFGLAKLRATPNVSGFSSAPTKQDITAEGTILGSLQYMAPEQLEGGEADARTDIFALGAVIYEMVTGARAFEGKSAASLMSAIMKDTPRPASSLQPVAPIALDRTIATCLAKDPENRWQSARDLCRELNWIADSSRTDAGTSEKPAIRLSRTIPLRIAALLVVAAILVTATAVWRIRPRAAGTNPQISHLSVPLQPGETLSAAGAPLALSPDGTMIAYASQRVGETRQLYLRRMDSPEARAVPGSDGANTPFFSADGQAVAFFAAGQLKKVPVVGGAVEALCEAGGGRGGTWGADGTIYFAPGTTSGLWSIPASGGTPTELTKLDRSKGEVSHRFPQLMPGGKALLFVVWTGPGWDESQLQVLTLGTGERHTVVQGARLGRYAASGHLIYSRNGPDTLMAVPFDLVRLQVTGNTPVTLTERVMDTSESGEFAISDSGTLAYVAGNPQRYESRLVWVDRSGVVEPVPAPARGYQEPVFSPDGRQIAISIAGPAYAVWTYDMSRRTLTPLISSGSSQAPIWTPDGQRLVYRATRQGFRNLYWRAVDGSGEEERLTTGQNTQTPGSWLSDGKQLLFQIFDPKTSADIWALTKDGKDSQRPIVNTSASESNPHLSGDGRWLAYVSDESGRAEIWVRPFPELGSKWKVSTEGGSEPVWSRDSRELFYRVDDKVMSVQVAPGPKFLASTPRMLFEGNFQLSMTAVSGYDVSPDGRRFLMVRAGDADQPIREFHVVLNWFEELKRK